MRDYEKSLNRRAEVEEALWAAARGKTPLPDAEQCRQWALRLGVPDEWRDTPVVRGRSDSAARGGPEPS